MKLQITITDKERDLLAKRASLLGFSVTKFTKYLLTNEAMRACETPVFEMSDDLEAKTLKAIADDEVGKTKKWILGKYGD